LAIAPDGRTIVFDEAAPGIGSLSSIRLIDLNRTLTTLSTDWRTVRGLVWAPRGNEIWFVASKKLYGAGTVFAITRGGALRELLRVPTNLDLFDVTADGSLLVGRSDSRLEARGLAPGAGKETDVSWFDYTGLSDLSDDGRTLIITEDGETSLQVYSRKTDGSP